MPHDHPWPRDDVMNDLTVEVAHLVQIGSPKVSRSLTGQVTNHHFGRFERFDRSKARSAETRDVVRRGFGPTGNAGCEREGCERV